MITSENYFSLNVIHIWKQLKKEPIHFWLFCGYLIFEYVRPQLIYTSIDVVPWAKIFVIGAAIGIIMTKEDFASYDYLAKYMLGLFLSVCLSSAFAEFPNIAFSQLNTVLNWVIIYYLFVKIITTKFRFFIVILLIMLASYKMSQHAALSWASRGFTYEGWGVAGAPGFFGNAADLGVQMLIILPLSIIFIKECYSCWGPFKKVFFILFPITTLMTIIAVGERNTLLGLAAMCFVSAISAKNRIKNIFLITIFAAGLIAIMPQELLDRFDTVGKDTTSLTRLTYWKQGIEFFKDHPVLGIGFNNWVPYYQKFPPRESMVQKTGEVAHSTPISVLAELGILGFIFYYAIVLKTILLNVRSMKIRCKSVQNFWVNIPLALNIGLFGFLAASIFITVTFYPFLFVQASLSAALYNIINGARINEVTD